MAERSLLVVLHDACPETWVDYRHFVAAVDALAGIVLTWLVVPDFHHRNRLTEHRAFVRLLNTRLLRGDELVLHGYSHSDDQPPPRDVRQWFMRRVYTWEGEFYDLDEDQATQRLAAGMALFRQFGWPLHGFVAPAWLLSPGSRRALSASGLSYTSDPQNLYCLPDFEAIAAPGLVWSAGSSWRRGASRLVSELSLQRYRHSSVLRLGLHPADMRHAFSRDYWLNLLQQLLDEGWTPRTKIDWLNRRIPLYQVGS